MEPEYSPYSKLKEDKSWITTDGRKFNRYGEAIDHQLFIDTEELYEASEKIPAAGYQMLPYKELWDWLRSEDGKKILSLIYPEGISR